MKKKKQTIKPSKYIRLHRDKRIYLRNDVGVTDDGEKYICIGIQEGVIDEVIFLTPSEATELAVGIIKMTAEK